VKKAKEAICVCFYKGKAKRKVMLKVKNYREESEFFLNFQIYVMKTVNSSGLIEKQNKLLFIFVFVHRRRERS
jgi:hypothetical protein